MLVGITYDLREDYLNDGFSEEETAEFDAEVTIDAIDSTLQQLGYITERIGNHKALLHSLVSGKRWDLVFNICEGMYGVAREAQVPALLDAYRIPYVFSDPLIMALTLNKALTKKLIRYHGIPTADFIVAERTSDIDNLNLPFPLFAKPVAEGTGKGISSKSIIRSRLQLKAVVSSLLEQYEQPVLIETYLPGREFTVGIVGTGLDARVVGVMEIVVTSRAKEKIYSFHTKENWHGVVEYPMAHGEAYDRCADVALSAWKALGCRDGGRVDLKMDANGVPNFIEVNPLAGINPEHSDFPMLARKVGVSYIDLIDMIMNSAVKRVNHSKACQISFA